MEADDLTEVDIEGLEADAIAASPVGTDRGASPLPSSSPPHSSPIRS